MTTRPLQPLYCRLIALEVPLMALRLLPMPKNSAKPVVAYISGMMASAAMWIGSAAAVRVASSSTDIIGSIGTMAAWNDYSGYLQQLGNMKFMPLPALTKIYPLERQTVKTKREQAIMSHW